MNKIRITTFVLAFFAFCSCSNDDSSKNSDNGDSPIVKPNPDEGGKTDPSTPNPDEGGKTDPSTPNPDEGGKTDPSTPDPDEGGKTDPSTPDPDEGGKTDPSTPDPDEGGKTDPSTPDPDEGGKTDPSTPDPDEGGKTDPSTPDPDEGDSWACGQTRCRGTQFCVQSTGACIERNEKAVEGVACNPNAFYESCDGEKLVYCDTETKLTKVSDCGADGSHCALKRDENFGMCVNKDERCTEKTQGEIQRCFQPEGMLDGYLEAFDCAISDDGNYYMFKTWKTENCVGVCLDDTQCALSNASCDIDIFESVCTDSGVAVNCVPNSEGTGSVIFSMNCKEDYNVGCIVEDGEAKCLFSDMN